MVWHPSDLSQSIWFYDPDKASTVVEVAGKVAQLDNQIVGASAGAGYQASSALQPLVGTRDINGRAVLESTGAGEHLEILGVLGVAGGQPRMQVTVVELDDNVGTVRLFTQNDNAASAGRDWYFELENGVIRAFTKGGYATGTTVIPTGRPTVLAIVFDNDDTDNDIATASKLYVDGKLETLGPVLSEPVNTNDTGNEDYILHPIRTLDGALGALYGTMGTLTQDEIDKTIGWFHWYYGLQDQLDLNHPYRWDGTEFGFGRYWNPSDIVCGGAKYWYSSRMQHKDTMTMVANKVSQWRDILGSPVAFEQINSAQQPTWNEAPVTVPVPAIAGDGGDLMVAGQAALAQSSESDLHVITLFRRGGNGDAIFEIQQDAGPVARTLEAGRFWVGWGEVNGPGTWPLENNTEVNRFSANYAAKTLRRHLSGSLTPSRSYTVVSPQVGVWDHIYVFDDATGGNAVNGYYVDLIFLFGTAALECLQRAEAYCAWVAGLEASLSADNPYKTGLPIIFPSRGGYGQFNYYRHGMGMGMGLGLGSAYAS